MVTAIPLCLYVESRQCFCSVVNRKSVQAGWIMVMSQRPGAWWEWRWMCGGWSGWKWGRLWKYDGLEFRLSLAAQRLSESYLKQIDFPWSLPLSSCLSASENLKPATKKKQYFNTRTFTFFTSSCVYESVTVIDILCKGHCSASGWALSLNINNQNQKQKEP